MNYASLHSSGNRRRKHKATVSRSDSKPSEDQQHPDSRSSASRDKKALQAEAEAPDKIGDYPIPIPQLKRRTRSRKKIDYARIHNGNDLFEAQQRQRQQQQQLQQQQQQQQEQQAQRGNNDSSICLIHDIVSVVLPPLLIWKPVACQIRPIV